MATVNSIAESILELAKTINTPETGVVVKDVDPFNPMAGAIDALTEVFAHLDMSGGGGMTEDQVKELIKAKIDELINGAPEAYDTLKEIADKIQEMDISTAEDVTLDEDELDELNELLDDDLQVTTDETTGE